MKATRIHLAALLACTLLSFGCSNDDDDDAPQNPQGQQQDNTTQQRIDEIKNQVRSLACNQTARFDADDNQAQIATQLDPQLRELQTLQAQGQQPDRMAQLVGSWRQVWSNFNEGQRQGRGALAAHVYQVIMPGDALWTIALTEEPQRQETMFLRGRYTLANNSLRYVYERAVSQPMWVQNGMDLNQLAMQAEAGAFDLNPGRFASGNNPIGQTVELEEVFADQDLRIARYNSGTGQSSLFIFERATAINMQEGTGTGTGNPEEEDGTRLPTPTNTGGNTGGGAASTGFCAAGAGGGGGTGMPQ